MGAGGWGADGCGELPHKRERRCWLFRMAQGLNRVSERKRYRLCACPAVVVLKLLFDVISPTALTLYV